MAKTHHTWTITRTAERSSAWLVTHKTSNDTNTQAWAFTTLSAARRLVANHRGGRRIRFNKLDDRNYDYNYSE
jgi:hypothetical protein